MKLHFWLCGAILVLARLSAAEVVSKTNFLTTVPMNVYIVADVRAGNGAYTTGFSFDPVSGDALPFDIITARYNSHGRALWTNVLESFPAPVNQDIIQDKRGNLVVLVTTFMRSLDTSVTMLRKLTSSGRVLWTRTNHWGDARSIYQANDGTLLIPFGMVPAHIAKLSPEGEGIWTNKFGRYPAGASSDQEGNVYFCAGLNDGIALAKFNSDGVLIWSNSLPAGFFFEKALAEDREGNIYVGVEDRVIKFNAEGTAVWTKMLLSPNIPNSNPTDVAVDRHGDVHVTGWSTTGIGPFRVVSAKLTPEGELLWMQAAPLPPGIAGDELSPPHFTSVQPKRVTVVQYFDLAEASGVYTFTTQTIRFREPKLSE